MRRAQEGGVLRAMRGLRAWLLREEGPSGWAWVPLGRPTLVSAVAESRYDMLIWGLYLRNKQLELFEISICLERSIFLKST